MAEPIDSPSQPEPDPADRLERRAVVILLRTGLAAAVALMVVGLALALGKGRLTAHSVPVRQVWPFIRSVRPSGYLAAGVLILVATPFLRVVTLIVGFVLDRDWRFAWIAVAVAAILILGIALGRN